MSHFRQTDLVLYCLLVAAAIGFMASPSTFGYDIRIDVAPNVINIQSDGEVVTVHTNIPYDNVVGSTVFLNDVSIYFWKSDARGYFVAKFISDEIKDLNLNIGDYNTLRLTGYDTNEEAFIGSQDILVINNIPQGR